MKNLIQEIVISRPEKMNRFFQALMETDKLEITDQTLTEPKSSAFCCDVLCIDCTVKEPIEFDDGRLKFKRGDEITFNVTADEREDFGSTSVSQMITYADGGWDIKDYDYISFTKTHTITNDLKTKKPNHESCKISLDWNKMYHYAKNWLKVIEGNIYIVEDSEEGHSYRYLSRKYVQNQENEAQRDLLNIILHNQDEVIKAIKKLEEGEENVPVKNATMFINNEITSINGLTVSNH